ncbi:MAG: hypothetical protein WC554_12165, partial [Clostridia bacterium]
MPVDRLGSRLLKSIYYEILEFYNKWDKIPDKNIIRQKFKDTLSEEEYENVKQFLERIWEKKYDSVPEAVFAEVINKYKARKLAISVEKIGKLLKEGKSSECDAILANYNNIISNISFEENFKEVDIGSSLENTIQEIKKDRDNPKEFKGVPTGIVGIDGIIKGLLPGEMGLIVGKTGGYKSTI